MSHHLELIKTLREEGLRLTAQRESVLAVIAESDTHLTAEEILSRVRARYPYFIKSTVYRNLETLVELGLVTQTDLGQGRIEYELHRHPHHHHLICRQCGSITQMGHAGFVPLEKQLRTRYGFDADLDHFAIFGTCRKCKHSETTS